MDVRRVMGADADMPTPWGVRWRDTPLRRRHIEGGSPEVARLAEADLYSDGVPRAVRRPGRFDFLAVDDRTISAWVRTGSGPQDGIFANYLEVMLSLASVQEPTATKTAIVELHFRPDGSVRVAIEAPGTFVCRYPEGGVSDLSRAELNAMMNTEPDLYMKLIEINPKLDRWHMGGEPA